MRIASSVKDFTVKPAAPVGNPSPDEQPRLGHDNITRCLRQRPPPGADPVTTATTAPSTRRVIRDLDDLKQVVMAAYKVDQTACADKLWFQVFSSTRVEADLQRFLYSDLVMLLPRATSRAEDLDAVYPRWRL